ncbi:Helicase associated domain (HA2) [Carpediemonas membranifera]|uniref:RNA helicase n=1 Tax=Carpediemonas membranifera TaxID=201153 RepID=A0A8J6BA93_9EUKA|nr:Helicase associated domain (HA2) [Carpediemonas membranifera]|eukprot:KAG9393207.1 Helicase associated domain (HA2) [Carpediemonas membranifera]
MQTAIAVAFLAAAFKHAEEVHNSGKGGNVTPTSDDMIIQLSTQLVKKIEKNTITMEKFAAKMAITCYQELIYNASSIYATIRDTVQTTNDIQTIPIAPPAVKPTMETKRKAVHAEIAPTQPDNDEEEAVLAAKPKLPAFHHCEVDPTPPPAPARRELTDMQKAARRAVAEQERRRETMDLRRRYVDRGLDGARQGFPQTKIEERRRALPVYAQKEHIIETIRANQVTILVGQTGSGKTTQVPQYLHEAGMTRGAGHRAICVTQPRRVAATSIARRVSEEMGTDLGDLVGYNVRFDDCTSSDTVIKFVTDGMLLRELTVDPYCSKYSVVMLDEAHERTTATDVLFALMKDVCDRRPRDFRLIISSATLDLARFQAYFKSSAALTIPGESYPVEVVYADETPEDYVQAAVDAALDVHLSGAEGDILVFLTGEEEINTACHLLRQAVDDKARELHGAVGSLVILPIYSSLPAKTQSLVFEPAPEGTRKVVISTNIAEASVTIDGIVFVIDSGFVKEKHYRPQTRTSSLDVTPISKAAARQRAGRCGRTRPGKCIRLYTQHSHDEEMVDSAVPEIQRSSAVSVVLLLKSIGIHNVSRFDLMDRLPQPAVSEALATLFWLGAVDDDGIITRMGKRMATFPIEPHLARMLMAAAEMTPQTLYDCVVLIGLLSVEPILRRPADEDERAKADQAHKRFASSAYKGDHETLLRVYQACSEIYKTKSENGFKQWCADRFVNDRAFRRAGDVIKQISGYAGKHGFTLPSGERRVCGGDPFRRAVTSGFFMNIAQRVSFSETGGAKYRVVMTEQGVSLLQTSFLMGRGGVGKTVVFNELVRIGKGVAMVTVSQIDPAWAIEVAPDVYAKSDGVGQKLEAFSGSGSRLSNHIAQHYSGR